MTYLERLDTRLQETFSLALGEMIRRQVRIRDGEHAGSLGVVQSLALGSRGELLARVRLAEKHPRRLFLSVRSLDVRKP